MVLTAVIVRADDQPAPKKKWWYGAANAIENKVIKTEIAAAKAANEYIKWQVAEDEKKEAAKPKPTPLPTPAPLTAKDFIDY